MLTEWSVKRLRAARTSVVGSVKLACDRMCSCRCAYEGCGRLLRPSPTLAEEGDCLCWDAPADPDAGTHGTQLSPHRVVPSNLISFLRASSGSSDPESDRLRPLTYPKTDVFIVCFSVGSATSLSSVKDKWIPEAIHHCPGVPCVIAATQIDLRPPEPKIKFRFPWQNKTAVQQDQQEGILITTAGGKKFTRELNAAAYVECSAKTLKGVQAVFDAAMIAAVEYQQRDILLRHRKGRKGVVI
ncbi:HHR209Cp [Mycena sanguinolenta]|uniref:HHR209Cp n=1 Tax=Mycena sanguinolenta TaxID=230812 RepID=A0A8H6XWR2_9AGAR|nr:HHR209Cp [Mycena sanguinolenta]